MEHEYPVEIEDRLPAVIVGHSHMQSVISNENIWSDHTIVKPVGARPDLYFLSGRNPRDDEYWSRTVELGARHRIVIFYGGSEHYSSFLIRSDIAFDFLCEEAPHLPLDPVASIIPSAMVRNFFDLNIAPLSEVLRRLKEVGARCTIVCSPPPKFLNDDQIRHRMEAFFLDKASSMGLNADALQFASATLMLKLWHVQAAAQRELASHYGFDLLMPPQTTVENGGFLKPRYWQTDITHANELYGTELLDNLLDHECGSNEAHDVNTL